ncbi:hypothetical protein ACFL0V_02120 [Nanoarchaeota archaeon]
MVVIMLNKRDLESIKKKIDSYEDSRDKVIKGSRQVIKLSKKIIYSLHRNNLTDASKYVKEINSSLTQLTKHAKSPKLVSSGSYKVAVQEYVEAICFYHLLKTKTLPTHTQLKVDHEYYLLGLIDLVGELVRRAINSAIKEDYKTSVQLKNLVSELYDELLLFDFAGGELRKKFDSIKYDLKKLEDLVLSLKLNNKI